MDEYTGAMINVPITQLLAEIREELRAVHRRLDEQFVRYEDRVSLLEQRVASLQTNYERSAEQTRLVISVAGVGVTLLNIALSIMLRLTLH